MRDAVFGLTIQAGASGVAANFHGFIDGQKQLAHRSKVKRCTTTNGPDHLHARALAVGAFNVNNFIALAHAQVNWLLDELVQIAHGGQSGVSYIEARLHHVAQF